MGVKTIFLNIIVLMALGLTEAAAQFRKIKTVNLDFAPDFVAVDRPGDIYLVHGKRVEQYNSAGSLQHKGHLPFKPDIFEPRDGSRLFAYNRVENVFLFFPPFFQTTHHATPSRPDSAFAIDPVLICSAGDHDLIILDSADWSMKKINLKSDRVAFESIISDTTIAMGDLLYMREYQNFVFMLVRNKGIVIFNMLGKRLRTISSPAIRHFNFLGEELYYQEKDMLVFFDLFNAENRITKLPYAADFSLLTDEYLYLVKGKKLEIFSSKP